MTGYEMQEPRSPIYRSRISGFPDRGSTAPASRKYPLSPAMVSLVRARARTSGRLSWTVGPVIMVAAVFNIASLFESVARPAAAVATLVLIAVCVWVAASAFLSAVRLGAKLAGDEQIACIASDFCLPVEKLEHVVGCVLLASPVPPVETDDTRSNRVRVMRHRDHEVVIRVRRNASVPGEDGLYLSVWRHPLNEKPSDLLDAWSERMI